MPSTQPNHVMPNLTIVQQGDLPTVCAVIVGYLLLLVCIGIVFRRFSHNASDYFRAGGQATWWLVGGSVFMGNFSAWTFTGAAGAAYQVGWSLVAMYGAGSLAYILLALGPAIWFRRTRVITVADVIRLRFGPGMEQFYAYWQSLSAPLNGGLQLYALAIFVTALLGFDIRVIILALGLVVLFYTAMSGAWAALAADFIKGLVLLPISALLAVVCVSQFGGIRGFLHSIKAADLQTVYAPLKTSETLASIPNITAGYFSIGFLAAYYCIQYTNINALTNTSRCLSVKDDRAARRACLLAAGALFVGMLIFFIPPMTARLLIPTQVAAMPLRVPIEGAYAAMAIHLLPAGLVGLVLVAICASTMSTLDLSFTSLAGLITQNIYPALCRRFGVTPWEGRARLILGRVVNLGCALMVITIAIVMSMIGSGGVFKLMFDITGLVVIPLTMPMMWGVFVRRVPTWGPPLSIVVGLVVSSGIQYGPKLLGTTPWLYHEWIFTLMVVSTLTFFGACFVYWRQEPNPDVVAREEEFFSRWSRPVDFKAEIGEGNDGRQMRIVGLFGLIMAAAILLMLIPASSAGHSGKILTIAGSTAAVGALLFFCGRRDQMT